VPNVKELKDKILSEAHEFAYSIHPGGNKMYHDLKATYWWYGMKRDVAEYVALCDIYQRVKAEHQRPIGLLQLLQVPDWKWEEIAMDFIMGLSRTQSRYGSIWVFVYRTDLGSSIYTCEDNLLRTTTGRVVYVKDSLSAWSAQEDCV
jgi:hypothetical protein